jgi:hypothetical protein
VTGLTRHKPPIRQVIAIPGGGLASLCFCIKSQPPFSSRRIQEFVCETERTGLRFGIDLKTSLPLHCLSDRAASPSSAADGRNETHAAASRGRIVAQLDSRPLRRRHRRCTLVTSDSGGKQPRCWHCHATVKTTTTMTATTTKGSQQQCDTIQEDDELETDSCEIATDTMSTAAATTTAVDSSTSHHVIRQQQHAPQSIEQTTKAATVDADTGGEIRTTDATGATCWRRSSSFAAEGIEPVAILARGESGLRLGRKTSSVQSLANATSSVSHVRSRCQSADAEADNRLSVTSSSAIAAASVSFVQSTSRGRIDEFGASVLRDIGSLSRLQAVTADGKRHGVIGDGSGGRLHRPLVGRGGSRIVKDRGANRLRFNQTTAAEPKRCGKRSILCAVL